MSKKYTKKQMQQGLDALNKIGNGFINDMFRQAIEYVPDDPTHPIIVGVYHVVLGHSSSSTLIALHQSGNSWYIRKFGSDHNFNVDEVESWGEYVPQWITK